TYEILKATPQSNISDVTNVFRFEEIAAKLAQAGDSTHDLPYEDVNATGAAENHPYRRLIERARTLYRRDDLSGPLLPGQIESLGLPYESYKLAFTQKLLSSIYSNKIPAAQRGTVLGDEGGYRELDGDGAYWICSGRSFFSPDPARPDPMFARSH